MSDFRDIEVKAGNHSLIITIVIGLLSLLFLLISFTFEQPQPKVQPIEIAMNFGNSELGQGEEEPQPNEESQSASAQAESLSSQTKSDIKEAVTNPTAEKVPTASKPKKKNSQPQKTQNTKTKPKPNPKPKPQGDAKGKAALKNLLSGKGKSKSSGQGNDGVAGNVGDPKGNDSYGTNIGENWKSRIPEPQSHNCSASGIIIVDIVVNAAGNVKSARAGARGSSSNDSCLKAKAKELVQKYVRAYPGKDGRRGSYRVNLR